MRKKYESWYHEMIERMNTGLQKQPGFVSLLAGMNKALTLAFYLVYPALLFWLFVEKDRRLVYAVIIPAAGFFLVSLMRKLIARPRPFALLPVKPLLEKENKNDSMPSRHVFSAMVITMVTGYFFPAAGALLFLGCILIGLIRVAAGVHYPSDVAAGLILGAVGGILFCWLVTQP